MRAQYCTEEKQNIYKFTHNLGRKATCERINEKTLTPQKSSLSVLVLIVAAAAQQTQSLRTLQKATYYLARSFILFLESQCNL